MVRQLSTALSDAALCYASFHAAYRVMQVSVAGSIGFGLVGVAAFMGTVRFALSDPPADLASFHQYLSWLANAVGVPYLAAAYHRLHASLPLSNLHLASGFILLAAQTVLSERAREGATEAVSGAGVVSLLLVSLLHSNAAGALGAGCYVVAGLVVKTRGHWLGVPRVDVFHYVLVLANIALMQGLMRIPQPVVYTPPVRS